MSIYQRTWAKYKHFFLQHTDNYEKNPTLPRKTPTCTTQTWCFILSQDCRKPCSRIKFWLITWQLFQNLFILWQTWCKAPINNYPCNYRRCRQWCGQCRCNILHHHSMPIKTMDAVDTTVDIPIIAAKENTLHNGEEICALVEVVRETLI